MWQIPRCLLHLPVRKNRILKTEFFIANRITFNRKDGRSFTGPIVNISVAGIALGLAVMILSMAIVTGFRNQVSSKVTGFSADVQISNFDANNSFETQPVDANSVPMSDILAVGGVTHVQPYVLKSGIVKTQNDIQAVVLKGIDQSFDWSFMREHTVAGDTFAIADTVKSNRIFMSDYMANLLHLSVGDKITVYFVQNPPRMRPFIVSGLYKTSIEDFDHVFALVDMRHLQKVNDWEPNQISGYEVSISNFDQLETVADSIFFVAGNNFLKGGSSLKITNTKERYPQIFDWLNLQDMNVWVILALMLAVAGFNMISGLLILILEKTSMIGLLKALGYSNWHIQKIFLIQSFYLIVKGLLWGNLIGIGLCLLQQHFAIVPLDESSYYMSTVPINLKWLHVVALNIGTLVSTLIVILLPSLLVSHISPAKAVKFN